MENKYGTVDELRLTVLVEDTAGSEPGLLSEHGISFLLEVRSKELTKKILFDTGQSASVLLNNLKILGFDAGIVDLIFISHCHYDHGGGLRGFLEAGPGTGLPVVGHPDLFRPAFSIRPALRSVGAGSSGRREAIEKAGGDLILTVDPLSLMPGVLTSGEIGERSSGEGKALLNVFTVEEGRLVPDRIMDDMALFIILPQGLVIVTGCAHAGIISLLERATQVTGIDKVVALVGGFHLLDAGAERIERTMLELNSRSVEKIYTGHCTGLQAEAALREAFGRRFRKIRTGMQMFFSGTSD